VTHTPSGSRPDHSQTNRAHCICSFCGKAADEVGQLIAGPREVYICDQCIDLCNRILTECRAKKSEECTDRDLPQHGSGSRPAP
jgi:hypothetical protein